MAVSSLDADYLIYHIQGTAAKALSQNRQEAAPYYHSQCEMLFVMRGKAEFKVADHTYQISKGSIMLINNLENHCIISHSADYDRYSVLISNEILNIHIADPILLSIFKQRTPGFCHEYRCLPEELPFYLERLLIMLREFEAGAPYWDRIFGSCFLEILIHMYRCQPKAFPGYQKPGNQQVVLEIQQYLEAHLEENLTLEKVAAHFYMDKYYLSHTFKKISGFTLRDYIVLVRIAKAGELLCHTSDSVRQICSRVGYGNLSHFIRTFRKVKHITPLQYRNQYLLRQSSGGEGIDGMADF